MAQLLTLRRRGPQSGPSAVPWLVGRSLGSGLLPRLAAALVMISVPIAFGLHQMERVIVRNHLDVLFEFATSPLILVLPAFAAIIGVAPLFAALGHRFVVNTRARVSVRAYLVAAVAAGVLWAFVAFAVVSFILFGIAFWIWPAVGNPNVEPANYFMTSAEAAEAAVHNSTFSQLLAVSDLAFGIGYSLWFGACGALYAGAASLALTVLHNRAAAVAAPLLLYLAQTVVASLLGAPQLGLLYSAVPFGLSQSPVLVGVLPTVVFAIIVTIGLGYTIARSPWSARFS